MLTRWAWKCCPREAEGKSTLQDILQAVGISKPFFYGNYYTSIELVIHIIDYEISLLLREAWNTDCGK